MTTTLLDHPTPAESLPLITSGCITGRPCQLGCSLFCALEPTDATVEPTDASAVAEEG